MEKRIKFIIIGFIIILGISFWVNLQIYSSKQMLLKERDELKKENALLGSKLNELNTSLRNNENRLVSLNSELDKVLQEKDEIQKRFDLLNKEQQELIDKLKRQEKATSAIEKEKPQVLPVTEDAYWAGIFKAKKELELQLDSLRQELKSVQINNEQLQVEKSGWQLELTNLNRDRQDLKRQLDYNQKLVDSLAQELVREKNDKSQITNIIKPIKNENLVLRRQLKSLSNRKVNLERKLTELQEENKAVNNRLNEMAAFLQEKTLQMDKWKEDLPESERESVELPPIVVRPQVETPTPETNLSLQARVLALNKDNNFVIVDLGEDAGIKVGDTFGVYRQDNAIATIEVMQLRKNISACDIKKEIAPIKVGDTVR